jgi:hypothetical protein
LTSPIIKNQKIKDLIEQIKGLPREDKVEFFKYLNYRFDLDYWLEYYGRHQNDRTDVNLYSVIDLKRIKAEVTPFDYEMTVRHFRRSKLKNYEDVIYSTNTVRLLQDDLKKIQEELLTNN